MIPHVTDAVQQWIETVAYEPVDGRAGPPDVCLVELGGTVGDIESAVFLEAIQQFQARVGYTNCCTILVGLVPVMGVVGEQKTKPVQHAVKLLRQTGLLPDFVFCRLKEPLLEDTRSKISLFCQVDISRVISLHDCSNVFHVPLLMEDQHLGLRLLERLGLSSAGRGERPPTPRLATVVGRDHLTEWRHMASVIDGLKEEITIAVVGKYTGLQDSYLSVIKAVEHAATEVGVRARVVWIESADLEVQLRVTDPARYDRAWSTLRSAGGVLVPGGFGDRGVEGKVLAAGYCRDHNLPFLGICLGLQIAVISFARDKLGMEAANSAEFNESTPHPVVVFMPGRF